MFVSICLFALVSLLKKNFANLPHIFLHFLIALKQFYGAGTQTHDLLIMSYLP